MSNIQFWEEKIKAKRMKTPFREFVREIASWSSMAFYKTDGFIARCPESDRLNKILSPLDFEKSDKPSISYGESMPFLQTFQELFQDTPFSSVIDLGGNENTSFSDCTYNSKNVYLSNTTIVAENILYSVSSKMNTRNVLNSIVVWGDCENVYMSHGIIQCFNIFYSRYINNSSNIWFSSNLIGCSECFGCSGLVNKSYCINNREYSKEDYLKFKKDLLSKIDKFEEWQKSLSVVGANTGSVNIRGGEFISMSDTVENGKYCFNIKDGRNVVITGGDKDESMYDCILAGSGTCSDFYGVINSGPSCTNLYICAHITVSSNMYYCYNCNSCSFCLGCIGLKNKSYCILNKQYTKEDWYELADKIFAQMDKDGTLGDFFPGGMNPFYFNDTMAYLIDDTFTKEEVEKEGYMWRGEAIKVDIPEGADIIETKDLNQYQGYDTNDNWTIQEEILKKVIRDEKGNFYKIVPMELEFLRKHKLPLPEIHWLERIKMGFRM